MINPLRAIQLYIINSYYFIMNSDIPPPSIKDRIAMFEKITSKSNTSSTNSTAPKFQPVPQQKPPTVPPISQPKNVETVPLAKNTSNKSGGEVQSPSIVKPSKAKQTQSYNLQNNYTYVSNPMTSSLSNKPSTPPPPPLQTQHSQNLVRVNQNGSVDKEKLLSQNEAKKMFEGHNLPIQTSYPAWKKQPVVIKEEINEGPKQAPIVQTDVHIGSVKDNTNKLNQYFVNRASQKVVEQQQARRRKQQQPPPIAQQVQQPKNEVNTAEIINGNSQNIPGGVFSQSPVQMSGESNSLNVANQNLAQSEESKDVETEDNSLVARLKKRKQMKKASFDSDED